VAVPNRVIERNKTVALAADVFFMDGITFLLTVSRNIKFITAKHVATFTAKSLSKHLNRVIQIYTQTGFSVRTILMDGKFKKVKNELPLIIVCNTTAAKEHMSKVEHFICMIKEQMRWIVSMLSFEYISRRLKMEFIYFVVLWLNAFPEKSGVSATYSPWELLVFCTENLITKSTAGYSLALIAMHTTNLYPQTLCLCRYGASLGGSLCNTSKMYV